MNNNEQQLPNVKDYIVHMNNSTYTNGRWVHGTNGQQMKLINTYIVQKTNFYINQIHSLIGQRGNQWTMGQ
jgi:mRNA-degrading endonuclease HigB of HigAB toxin-antitoxin module